MKCVLIQLPFYLFCFAGCLVQVINISHDYFRYGTTTKTTISYPEYVLPPNISFCSRIGEVVDIEKAHQLHNITFNGVDDQFHLEVFTKLTLSQIFNLVPVANETLLSCRLREPGQYFSHSEERCSRYFSVSRYFMQNSICYLYAFTPEGLYDFESVSQADIDRGRIYSLHLSYERFKRVKYLTIIVHASPLPTDSRYFSARTLRKIFSNENYSSQTGYTCSYVEFTAELLPFPYDTSCGLNNGLLQTDCNQICLTEKAMRTFNRIPFNWLITEANTSYLDNKLLANADFKNKTLQRLFTKIQHRCRDQCRISDCLEYHFSTKLLDIDYQTDYMIHVRVLLPLDPSVRVVFDAKFSTTDYIVFVMSCLGTWLGISMVHLDPIKLFGKQLRHRNRVQRRVVVHRWYYASPKSKLINYFQLS